MDATGWREASSPVRDEPPPKAIIATEEKSSGAGEGNKPH